MPLTAVSGQVEWPPGQEGADEQCRFSIGDKHAAIRTVRSVPRERCFHWRV